MIYRRLGRSGLEVSEIGLGTVELGIDYGIRTGKSTNQPTESDAARLLNHALDVGVNFIDTAAAYGTSEAIIGRVLKGRREQYCLATKCLHWQDEQLSENETRKRINDSIESSLKDLQTDVIDLLQIHGRDIPELEMKMIDEGLVWDVLDRARQSGKVRFLGYSSYSETVSLKIVETRDWDTLQVAYNVFDQRNANAVITAAHIGEMGVIIRSALLKGVLSDKANHLPDHLSELVKRTHTLQNLLDKPIPSIPQLALRFVLSNPKITCIVVGADKIVYLDEAVSVSDGNGLPRPLYQEVASLAIDDTRLLNPGTWGIP